MMTTTRARRRASCPSRHEGTRTRTTRRARVRARPSPSLLHIKSKISTRATMRMDQMTMTRLSSGAANRRRRPNAPSPNRNRKREEGATSTGATTIRPTRLTETSASRAPNPNTGRHQTSPTSVMERARSQRTAARLSLCGASANAALRSKTKKTSRTSFLYLTFTWRPITAKAFR